MNKYRKALVMLLFAGLALSVYLTYVHYNVGALVCPTTGLIDCEGVLGSVYATVLGTPIALLATGWFLLAIFCVTRFRKIDKLLGIIALGAVVYSFSSMYVLGKLCIWCMGVDILLLCYMVLVLGYPKRLED